MVMSAVYASHGSNEKLQMIIVEVHSALYKNKMQQNTLLAFIAKPYQQRCRSSWKHILLHLEKFLADPKLHYTHFMEVLEKEMDKFPDTSIYKKHLQELAVLIAQGPSLQQNAIINALQLK